MDRRQQIESLFQQALQHPPAERDAWLREACNGDSGLQREVASLLANHRDGSESRSAAAAAQLVAGPAPLEAGQCLGPYEILASIGAGGMGKVYKARDTRLKRDVAIKVCEARFSDRFEREARVIASLNHPNICHLHDVGANFLVMELVEGEPLSGPLPVEAALNYARQIAEALEAAHEKGIVHRDLKPANIKVKADGTVKVLDFGLAKAAEGLGAPDDPNNSPTQITSATRAGMILGTAAYMSPEQARGATVDKRTDIWAFGCVLYEMLIGRPAFEGKTTSDVLAAVIRDEPDWDAVPPKIQRLLRECLKKDPKARLHDIADANLLLEDAPGAMPTRDRKWPWLAAAAVAVLLAAALPLAVSRLREKPPQAAVPVRFQIPPPAKTHFGIGLSLSPDGRWLAFDAPGPNGRTVMWVRSLDSLESRPLPGTEGALGTSFWSPDSRFLGFTAEHKLMKIAVAGGPPQVICDGMGTIVGGAWTRDGVIVFGDATSVLRRVPAVGGVPTPLTRLDSSRAENAHMLPSLLPDDRHFVYLHRSARKENTGIYIGSLDAKPEEQDSKPLLATLMGAVWTPGPETGANGYLLFLRDSTLMAQPFDAQRLALAGELLPVAEGVGSIRNLGDFAVSRNGILAYRSGGDQKVRFTWFDRQGNTVGTVGNPGPFYTPANLALSPDGRRVATHRGDPRTGNLDIWVLDPARDTSTRLTSDPAIDVGPVWSPDGSRIVFASNRDGPYNLYERVSSGAGGEEPLLKSNRNKLPRDWSRDGRFLLYAESEPNKPKINWNLWILPLFGDRKPVPLLQSEFNEGQAQFSPDGRWIAYRSDKSGTPEIYVRPFSSVAAGGEEWTISNAGGTEPRWRRDGKELFYFSGEGTLMAVEVTTSGAAFKAGIPKRLFETRILAGNTPVLYDGIGYFWDVAPDGKRFLVDTATPESGSAPITVVLNWMAGLKK